MSKSMAKIIPTEIQLHQKSRILEIVFSIFFHKGLIVHVDVFSGNAFNIAVIASYVARLRKN